MDNEDLSSGDEDDERVFFNTNIENDQNILTGILAHSF